MNTAFTDQQIETYLTGDGLKVEDYWLERDSDVVTICYTFAGREMYLLIELDSLHQAVVEYLERFGGRPPGSD
ncbi:hypothetical protein [Luteolibacter sp. LG18]|uniref:hypothetical protein n=1 Tax=Luteolibacter sp. LG18 TaxID=2819286 RepID=UPI002B29BD68|nr:hypothetical protein llg_27230 [Luteolibacter sp. LG18]